MKSKMFIIIFCSIFIFTACSDKIDGIDLSEFTETHVAMSGVLEDGKMVTYYKIWDVELSSENIIHLKVNKDLFTGTFVKIEDGHTVFSIEEFIDDEEWIEMYNDNLIRVYYD